MNVYQETIKVLKELNATREQVLYCSHNAFELLEQFEQGKSIKEIAQYCIDNA